MKHFVLPLLALALTSTAQARVETYKCVEISWKNNDGVPVKNGKRMTVVAMHPDKVEEGVNFPVLLEVVQPGKGKVFSGRISGDQEDVMFRFGGGSNGIRLSGMIYMDELNQTSVRLHKGKERLNLDFDCTYSEK